MTATLQYADVLPDTMEAIKAWVGEVYEQGYPNHRFIAGVVMGDNKFQVRQCLCSTDTATEFVKALKDISSIGLPGVKPHTTGQLKEIIKECTKTKKEEKLVIVYQNNSYEINRMKL